MNKDCEVIEHLVS